jgi:HPt (histidine-containing phosphotransfer) domain-containing protein
MQTTRKPLDRAAVPADQQNSPDALASGMAGELDLTDLVAEFVAKLPARVAALHAALVDADCDSLAQLACQLKDSAGRYGFPSITQAAQEVEARAGARKDLERLGQDIEALAKLCRWMRPQAPTGAGTACNASTTAAGRSGRQSGHGSPQEPGRTS